MVFSHKDENKKHKLFLILGAFFITNAIVAEFIGAKLFSMEKTFGFAPANLNILGGNMNFDLTAGVILWPVVFIITDIINEYYGKKGVRKLTWIAILMLVYSFAMVYAAIGLKGADFWIAMQTKNGIANMDGAFSAIFGQGLAIIMGSLSAFLIGQLVDAAVFHAIKSKTNSKMIWLRATGSTLVSQLIDSFVVLFIAFYLFQKLTGQPPWSLEKVMQTGILNYIYKFCVALLLTPALYLFHSLIDKYLGKNLANQMQQEAVR